ncbi:MAG: thioredoxin-disulfide reductase [Bacilli bacterium]|nr:thioredoxin-disulfide reductase [Bacilli bacterium]
MFDIIIVGAGPAGLTAALYALRANKKVLILEASNYGGKIINAHKIENYPGINEISGYDFATNLYNQVKKFGGQIVTETVLIINEDKTVVTNKNTYEAKAIIIATGLTDRRLNIENEKEFIGKGVSYCATCDGNFYKNKTVAVVGGGDTAFEDAIYLSDIASKVYLIHHSENFSASEVFIDKLKEKSNVEYILNAKVEKINGSNTLESIDINVDNNKKNIQIDGLFIAIGREPKNEIFSNIVELDEKGYIISNDLKTKVKGIYTAGDVRKKELRQLTTAVSDGSLAATLAIKEMN